MAEPDARADRAGEWQPPAETARRRTEAEAGAVRDVTFREYAERWLKRIEREPSKGGRLRRPSTLLDYRRRVYRHLIGPLGDLRVRDIDAVRLRALIADIAARPSVRKPDSPHNGIAADVVDTLKMVLRQAVRDGILPAVPDVAAPPRKSVRDHDGHTPEDDVATPAQVEALYEAVPQEWRSTVLLAAWCQLRRGEVLGLQRRDIVWNGDRTAAILYVRRQKHGWSGKLTDPKSDSGIREISVPPIMIGRLREHLDKRVGEVSTAPVIPTHEKGVAHLSAPRWSGVWAGSTG